MAVNPLDVLSRVPQGPPLGAILFLVYVIDITADFDSGVSVTMFADGSVIYK